MKIVDSISELKRVRSSAKGVVGFIPTMGGLHPGHFSLVEKSKRDNDCTVVSIFVNPTQFNNSEDLKNYPSSLNQDIENLEKLGVDILFLPQFNDIYPDNYKYKISETNFSSELCGKHRPGHFDGVLTVVMKLFNIVSPDYAYFGEKDYQQLQLIKSMVESFFLNIKIVSQPTVREITGLAMSSRNERLSSEARAKAALIYTLIKNPSLNKNEIWDKLIDSGITPEYLEEFEGRRYIAAHIENVRLIDNVQQ